MRKAKDCAPVRIAVLEAGFAIGSRNPTRCDGATARRESETNPKRRKVEDIENEGREISSHAASNFDDCSTEKRLQEWPQRGGSTGGNRQNGEIKPLMNADETLILRKGIRVVQVRLNLC
jgi:hypothetical protein